MLRKEIVIGPKKIAIYGSSADIATAVAALDGLALSGNEATDRLLLQEIIDIRKLKASILYDGNTVWGQWQLLPALKRVVKANDTQLMTKQLYKFFSLSCGSIAHYNLQGWAHQYPDTASLRAFFKKNEYGQSVKSHLSHWNSDARRVVEAMEIVLGV